MADVQDAVQQHLSYYVNGPTYQLRLPALLARASRNAIDGRTAASVAALDQFVATTDEEALLVELIYGWSHIETQDYGGAALHLDAACEMAETTGNEIALVWAMTLAASNSFTSGARDESIRLVNRAAALSPFGSDQSLVPLLLLAHILTVNRAPGTAEAILLELSNSRSWPVHAESRMCRRLARVQIELDMLADAAELADRIGETSATDRDLVEHSILLTHLAAASGQWAAARAELRHATELLSRVDVQDLVGDFHQARVAVALAEAAHHGDEASRVRLHEIVDNVGVGQLTPRLQGLVIDSCVPLGDFGTAWKLSNDVMKVYEHENVGMREVFDLTIKLNDFRAESRFAQELAAKHRELHLLETRSSAVLSALAHGVRDPLTVLKLWFADQAPSRDTRQERLMAEAAVERVDRLLEEVVWVARAGRFVPATIERSIDLRSLANHAIDEHQCWADFHGLQMVDRSPHTTVGSTDASDGLAALVSALMSHATAYCCDEGQIEIDLRIEGDALQIVMTDEGPDVLPQSQRESAGVWEVDLPRARAEGGDETGDLGLFLAESLADLYGSSIEFDRLANGRVRTALQIPLVRAGN